MGVIGPLFCFEYTNFKVSLIIKIINFNGIKNMAQLTMLVIFHVNVITCQNYHTFITSLLKIIHFLNEKFQISHMVSKHGSNYVK
jgi:hypothetical protein